MHNKTILSALLLATLLTACEDTGKDEKKTETANTSTNNNTYTRLLGHETDCMVDTTNNLIWELKQINGLHDKADTYTWYDSNAAAGKKGTANGGVCQQSGRCDTEKFVADVNAASWCGFNDWRLPTRAELKTLLDKSKTPMINTRFLNTIAKGYWTSPSFAQHGDTWADAVSFGTGTTASYLSSNKRYVRLVRNKN